MSRVLLVEDDPAIARSVVFALEREGFSVRHALLLADARQQLAGPLAPEVLVLDLGLPDGNGLDFLRQLRASSALPTVILSARTDEVDKVLGLELGADDYLAKPFSPRELCARVRALLRRAAGGAQRPKPAAGLFEWDTGARQVALNAQVLELTRLEYDLLYELHRHAGAVRSREQLLHAVWGDDSQSLERTVDTHIKTLRAKLQQALPQRDLIVTHRSLGYALRNDEPPCT